MVTNAEGTLVPQMNESRCNGCGLCLRVCPGTGIDIPGFQKSLFGKLPVHPEIGNFLQTYAGYAVDDDVRFLGQSGGMISALLIHLLESGKIDGALVTRWSKDDPFAPETYIARSREDILDAVGSKYCPVPVAAAMKLLFREKGSFVFVGTACQTQAMRKAAELKPSLKKKIFAYFGLYCLDIYNNHFFEYILGKSGIHRNNVRKFEFRSKKWRGWPCDLRIETHDGQVINIAGVKSRMTTRQYFRAWRCLLCPDKLNDLADISFGDCRIPRVYGKQTYKETHYNGNPGQSDVICRTTVGQKILEEAVADNAIRLHPTQLEEVLKSTAVSGKKLCLSNIRLFAPLFRIALPDYGVRYYPKTRKNRFFFALMQLPSVVSLLHFLLFRYVAKHPRQRKLLQLVPYDVLKYIALLREKMTNYYVLWRSELTAVYPPSDSEDT